MLNKRTYEKLELIKRGKSELLQKFIDKDQLFKSLGGSNPDPAVYWPPKDTLPHLEKFSDKSMIAAGFRPMYFVDEKDEQIFGPHPPSIKDFNRRSSSKAPSPEKLNDWSFGPKTPAPFLNKSISVVLGEDDPSKKDLNQSEAAFSERLMKEIEKDSDREPSDDEEEVDDAESGSDNENLPSRNKNPNMKGSYLEYLRKRKDTNNRKRSQFYQENHNDEERSQQLKDRVSLISDLGVETEVIPHYTYSKLDKCFAGYQMGKTRFAMKMDEASGGKHRGDDGLVEDDYEVIEDTDRQLKGGELLKDGLVETGRYLKNEKSGRGRRTGEGLTHQADGNGKRHVRFNVEPSVVGPKKYHFVRKKAKNVN